MQRRAAAVLFVFFLVMGTSAYSVIAMAEEPAIQIEDEGQTYEPGSNFTIGGQEYNLSEVSVGDEPSGTLVYTIDDALQSETFDDGSTVELENGTYLVSTGSAPDPTTAPADGGNVSEENGTAGNATDGNATGENATDGNETADNATDGNATEGNATAGNATGNDTSAPETLVFTEERDVEGILENDTSVANETVAVDDQEYVRVLENNQLVPLSEYLEPAEQRTYEAGDSFEYENRTVTVENVTDSSATVTWRADQTVEQPLEEGGNVTLSSNGSNETYVVNFPGQSESDQRVVFSSNYDAYRQEIERQDYFHERINGLWGVLILSGIAAFVLLAMAYMPVRG
ncbi:hypothetical protein [Halomarina ordinaria]|uniref:DUF4178 domain-containing protein n=1 Tax=Halomarina ordinaria TaxID=3033939 RepID=A0ABD5U8T6_9EURY|nr:hypothetical protein [Halomarina sp. PSRA2]